MSVAMDQRFAERIARIQSGKQWIPDGVAVPSKKELRRAKQVRAPLPWYNRLLSFLLTLALVGGVLAAFLNYQPDLVGRILSDDSSTTSTITRIPAGG
ncbi:hypothetical protein [Tropicimonas marinistellae]|uniref:hypothetical protein n=1 Tax=Tropicimonas marinistellae TaxID=1739787 RepID=UPI00082C2C50|nr:hypothetical protein [Tropicimonas marinistellae]